MSHQHVEEAAEAEILGQLLTAMPLLEVLPTEGRIEEFLGSLLRGVPGVAECEVFLQNPEASPDEVRRFGDGYGWTLPLESGGHGYGALLFKAEDEKDLSRYRPFLENLATSLALLLENRWQRDRLEETLGELKTRGEEYRSLFESMSGGYAYCQIVYDEHQLPVDFIYLAVNPAFEELTGLRDVVGKPVTEVIPGIKESSPGLLETYGRVALTGQPEQFELDLPALDMILWTSVYSPAKDHFVAVFDNVTERKRAEAALRESHDLLANLALLVPGAIYQYRLYPDGRSAFPYSSPGMNDIYEVTPEEVREDATPVFGRLHPDDYDYVADAIAESARTLQTFYCEFRVILPRQGLRWRWSQAQPVRMEDGGTLWHGIISDVTERKEAEDLLRLMQYSVDQAAESVLWVAPHGGFLYVNELECQSLGYSRDELLSLSVFDVSVGVSAATWPQRWEEIKEAQGVTFENLRRRKDGSVFPVEITSRIIEYDGKELMCSFVHDITERKHLEESLQRTQFAVDHSSDLVHWFDPEGRCLYVNDSSCRRLGYTHEELLSMTIYDIDPNAPRPWSSHFQEVKERGSFTFESSLRTKGGEFMPVDVTVNYVNYGGQEYNCATSRDITERKRAEAEYRTLFNEMLDGFAAHEIVCDDDGSPVDYRFLAVNPAFESMTGLRAEDIVGRTVLEVLPSTEKHWIDTYGRVALTGTPAHFENYHAGLNRHFQVTAFRPAFHQFVCMFADITKRKQAEEALRQSEEHLRQSQKMEAVGQLAGGIAHDFNNLLTAILGYSELILASGSSTVDEVRPGLEEIKRAGERASALTQQILTFSRRQILRPQVVLLDEVIRGIEPLLRRSIGEDVDLEITESPGLSPVDVDPHQFEQVLMNLVINARDAMPSGGRLTIETANAELDEEFCGSHAGALPGSYVLFRVSDTGVGIDAATQERIFEPFFTTKAVGAGTGLGLATVYGIVKQSNGSIFVTSEPGRGSSFAIYLPRAAQPAVPEETLIPSQAPAGGPETVMVVEDEEALRGLIEHILGAAGYATLIFSSSQEALAALEHEKSPIDLLLTDVMLPGPIQGHHLARAVLAARPDLPVLYISGYSRDALVHAGRLDEGVNLLEKPFTAKSLRDTVREVLDLPRATRVEHPALSDSALDVDR